MPLANLLKSKEKYCCRHMIAVILTIPGKLMLDSLQRRLEFIRQLFLTICIKQRNGSSGT